MAAADQSIPGGDYEASVVHETNEPTEPAGQGQGDTFQFVANLTDRQHSLMLNGRGDRLLVELEAFGTWALMGLVGLAKFTGKTFLVTVQEIPDLSLTNPDDEPPDESPKKPAYRVGRRRSTE